jgi:hypothetical protein
MTESERRDRRDQAERLRGEGWSVPDIAVELGVAKSTAFQWVRHIPLDRRGQRARSKREHAKRILDAHWAAYREARAAERAAVRAAGAGWVGQLSPRELLLIGAVMYWCEGAKGKPWRPDPQLIFTNSDPLLVEIFIMFVEALGVPRASLKYRVSIHESADAARAMQWWATRVRVPVDRFQRPTLKRHNPKTNRHNVGDTYRGCLVVTVPRGRALYWQIEGVMQGLAECDAPA